jgi:hypothetical protein
MMPVETMTSANVKQAVPFFGVTSMEASLRFYVDGLGFKMKRWWIPDQADGQDDYKPDGRIRWCWLELGEAAIMLRSFCRNASRRKSWERESTSVFSAKMRLRSIASSNRAESRHGHGHLWETACGWCR